MIKHSVTAGVAVVAKSILVAASLALCGLAAAEPLPGVVAEVLAIEHVTVLPMTSASEPAVRDATVLIRDGRITSISASGATSLPANAQRIDGSGKWLIPALADCHVHIENDRLARVLLQAPDLPAGTVNAADLWVPYVANGVLQIINMSAMSESVGQRDAVESGRVLGPHVTLAAMVDGSPPIWPVGMTRVAATAADGRQVVRDIKAEGYDLVKVYSQLSPETFAAIVEEANQQGLRVLGHIPARGQRATAQFFGRGFAMAVHAEEFAYQSPTMSDEDIARYVSIMKNSGAWLTATLTLNERILEQVRAPETLTTRPELRYISMVQRRFSSDRNPYLGRREELTAKMTQVVDFNRRLVRAFAKAGIPIAAGTDSGVPGVAPGFALHDELAALVKAGLTPQQALASATRLPAQWLGTDKDRGTVAVGKRADLVLLDADPLADINNSRRIAAVIASGRYLSRDQLDALLKDVSDRSKR